MLEAIESNMNDVMIDPQEVVVKVIKVYFQTQQKQLVNNQLNLDDLM